MSRRTQQGRSSRGARLRTVVMVTACALAGVAVIQELSRPRDQRTWHGRALGVPYDFRPPSIARMQQTMWAPDDARLLVPKSFGLGWDLNVGRVIHLLGNQPTTD